MQELIEKLKNNHAISAEQAHAILQTIKNYVKEKFPMVGGAIDKVFPSEDDGPQTDSVQTVPGSGDTGTTEGSTPKGGSFSDKVSGFLPGQMGEEAEQFAKDKLSGIFGGYKNPE